MPNIYYAYLTTVLRKDLTHDLTSTYFLQNQKDQEIGNIYLGIYS